MTKDISTIEVTVWRERGLEPASWMSLAKAMAASGDEETADAAEAARWAAGLAHQVRYHPHYGKRLRHALFVLSVQPVERVKFFSWLMETLAGGRDLNDAATWFEIGADLEQGRGGCRLPDDTRVSARMAAERLGVAYCTADGDFTAMLRNDLEAVLFAYTPPVEPVRVRVTEVVRGPGEKQGAGVEGWSVVIDDPDAESMIPPPGECYWVETL